jgi:beta-glucosidase
VLTRLCLCVVRSFTTTATTTTTTTTTAGNLVGAPPQNSPPAEVYARVINEIQRAHLDVENGGNGIPILYGIDSVHGANYIRDAVIFPQQLSAGASFNRALTRVMGDVTAKDTAAAGIRW